MEEVYLKGDIGGGRGNRWGRGYGGRSTKRDQCWLLNILKVTSYSFLADIEPEIEIYPPQPPQGGGRQPKNQF